MAGPSLAVVPAMMKRSLSEHLKHDTSLYSGIANRKLIVAIGIASLAKSDLASHGVPLG